MLIVQEDVYGPGVSAVVGLASLQNAVCVTPTFNVQEVSQIAFSFFTTLSFPTLPQIVFILEGR